MEIITIIPPHSTKSQNKRKKTINKVFISLNLQTFGGGEGIIQEQDGDADCTFIQRGQVPTFKGQMSIPSYRLDTIFLCRGQTTLAMRHMFAYPMKKVF